MPEHMDARRRVDTALLQAGTIGKLYYNIVEVQLKTGQALVLKNDPRWETTGRQYAWTQLLEENLQWIYPEDRPKLLNMLSLRP